MSTVAKGPEMTTDITFSPEASTDDLMNQFEQTTVVISMGRAKLKTRVFAFSGHLPPTEERGEEAATLLAVTEGGHSYTLTHDGKAALSQSTPSAEETV